MKKRKTSRDRTVEVRELYRWWFEFLKLNEEYAVCCKSKGAESSLARLYDDFGDIFNTSFDDWYSARADSLFKKQRFLFDRVDTGEAFRAYSSDQAHAVVLAVSLDAPRDQLLAEFTRFLALIQAPRRGRRKKDFSGAWYPLRQGPSPRALATIYSVYNAYLSEQRAGRKQSLWAIGQRLLAPEQDRRRALAQDEKHNYDVRVRRYIAQAEALVRNATLNLFPIDRFVEPDEYPSLQRMDKIIRG